MRGPPVTTVWERVKEALISAGLKATQKNAAKIAGIKQSSVSQWNEHGNNISIENAVAISQATGFAVEYLVTGRGPVRIAPPDDALARELWRLWPQLPEAVKGRLVGIAGEYAPNETGTPNAPVIGVELEHAKGRAIQRKPKFDA